MQEDRIASTQEVSLCKKISFSCAALSVRHAHGFRSLCELGYDYDYDYVYMYMYMYVYVSVYVYRHGHRHV